MGDLQHDFRWRLRRFLWRWERPLERAFVLIAGAYIVIVLLTGCGGYAQPFIVPPRNMACVQVHWTDDIQAFCPAGAAACATTGASYTMQRIWIAKPLAFDDYDAVYRLGHEFLHSLGAEHK